MTDATDDADEFVNDLADELDTDVEDLDGDWSYVRELLRSQENGTTGVAKQTAAQTLLDEFNIITVEETKDDEADIWRYNPTTGIFENDGLFRIRKRLADGLAEEYSRSRVNDIIHRLRSETYVKRETLGAPDGLLCLTNHAF